MEENSLKQKYKENTSSESGFKNVSGFAVSCSGSLSPFACISCLNKHIYNLYKARSLMLYQQRSPSRSTVHVKINATKTLIL